MQDDVFANGVRVSEIVLGQADAVGVEVDAAYKGIAVVAEK
jgi:hypothetical protein